MATLKSTLEAITGIQRCPFKLRDALERAALGYDARTILGGRKINITVLSDYSDIRYNEENTFCLTAKLTDVLSGEEVCVGYYSDNAQHVLDILDEPMTVPQWASLWDDPEGLVPSYLAEEGFDDSLSITLS